MLLIYCNDLSKSKFDSNVFVDVIEFVNARGLAYYNKPFVILCPIESDILSIMKVRNEGQQSR